MQCEKGMYFSFNLGLYFIQHDIVYYERWVRRLYFFYVFIVL